jgi:hypothetical protein
MGENHAVSGNRTSSRYVERISINTSTGEMPCQAHSLQKMRRNSAMPETKFPAIKLIVIISILTVCNFAGMSRDGSVARAQPAEPPPVYLDTPLGQSRLLGADSKGAYWPLSMYFETQKNRAYCTVASAVMALNALDVPRPKSRIYPDYPFYTQDEFFDNVDPSIPRPDDVNMTGPSLDQLANALESFPVKVDKYHTSDPLFSESKFRTLIRQATEGDRSVMLLNFDRREIGQQGASGHWSPIAAYDSASDSALLLDVARFIYHPAWVSTPQLFRAVSTTDVSTHLNRGALVLSKNSA